MVGVSGGTKGQSRLWIVLSVDLRTIQRSMRVLAANFCFLSLRVLLETRPPLSRSQEAAAR